MVNNDSLISSRVLKLWNNWELRIIMILSMSLQIFLMLSASRRKTSKNMWLISLIGIAHSLANWIAAYGVGVISCSQDNNLRDAVPNELATFWACFFLMHLSGANSITSLTLDDEYSWLKQLVGLVARVLAIVFIFLKSFPNKLWVPTILILVVGIFRNAQRVISLSFWSHGNLKGTSATFHHAKVLSSKRLVALSLGMPEKGKLDSLWILEYGNLLSDTFKCFITKATFSSEHCLLGREFFRNRTPMEAFKITELELYCLYEALYTEFLNFRGILGNVFSLFNVYLLIACFVIFGGVEKNKWQKFDLVLTYVLLSSAIAQEFICTSGFMFSPRIHRTLKSPGRLKIVDDYIVRKRKWSESVCQINLLAWCVGYHCKLSLLVDKIAASFCLKDVVDILRLERSVSVHAVTEDVKEIIFDELRTKSAIAENKETAIKICSQRGDWALMRSSLHNKLKWSLGELEYGKSLILWHIATELCYNDSKFERNGDERRTFCKILSDYMLYLLVLKPKMMASVAANWERVFHDTRAHARGFFLTRSIKNKKEACKQILSAYRNMTPRMPIGERSKSVLVDASVLAIQLQDLQGNQWKLMSKVWVELLSYAAFHCEADIHAQQPSQGGELLTFVWLLINHLGFGKQVMKEDAPRTEY